MKSILPLDPDVYSRLQNLAHRIHAEKAGPMDSLDPVGLLHEAWLKLEKSKSQQFADQRHFYAVCARAMRQILVDRARAKASAKRGSNPVRVQLAQFDIQETDIFDVLAVDRVLQELRRTDARAADVALLRAFGGLTVPEVAHALSVSPRTVQNSWKIAREFLAERLMPVTDD